MLNDCTKCGHLAFIPGLSDDSKSYIVKNLFGYNYGGQWPYAETEEQCLILLDYLYKNQEKIVKGLDDYK